MEAMLSAPIVLYYLLYIYPLVYQMYTSFVVAIIFIAVLLTAARCTAKTTHHLYHHQAFIPPIKIRRKVAIINKHSISLRLAKKSYDKDKKKVSQQEILLDLDRKFDYEGRIKSKIVDVSDNDDEAVKTSEEEAEASHPHRCALLTILG